MPLKRKPPTPPLLKSYTKLLIGLAMMIVLMFVMIIVIIIQVIGKKA